MTLVNTAGQQLKSWRSAEGSEKEKLDIRAFPAGVYFLNLETANGQSEILKAILK